MTAAADLISTAWHQDSGIGEQRCLSGGGSDWQEGQRDHVMWHMDMGLAEHMRTQSRRGMYYQFPTKIVFPSEILAAAAWRAVHGRRRG